MGPLVLVFGSSGISIISGHLNPQEKSWSSFSPMEVIWRMIIVSSGRRIQHMTGHICGCIELSLLKGI